MGVATQREANAFVDVFEEFAGVLGLEVNPDKSTVWFSKRCNKQRQQEVLHVLQAKVATNNEKYLGVVLTKSTMQHNQTGKLIVKKFQDKLAGWKVNLLSHAGRTVLIQSVLTSLPVYYMAIEMLNGKTLDELNGLMRRFLWGKVGQARYLSMIAWEKVCQTHEDGGLGIKNIKLFNKALLDKLVWQLGTAPDRLWVQVVREKYYPGQTVWEAKAGRNTSPLWKAIQECKGEVGQRVAWDIGDRERIQARGQPWFQGWEEQRARGVQPGTITVAELYDFQHRQWRQESIEALLGTQALQHIVQNVRHPVQGHNVGDRLIWMPSKKGSYTVKKGYKILVQVAQNTPQYDQQKLKALRAVWNWKEVLPRVKTFVWRALHNGLTTTLELFKRMQRIPAVCLRCQQENEFTMHLLFFCPLSRATWYLSQFALRVGNLPLNLAETILMLTENLQGEEVTVFCNIMWELWKARNEELFQAKKTTPQVILAKARNLNMKPPEQPVSVRETQTKAAIIPSRARVVLVDASWDEVHGAGIGMVVFNRRNDLVYMQYNKVEAGDPFQAEAVAVYNAIQYVLEGENDGNFVIFSDCLVLVRAITGKKIDDLPSWQAAEVVMSCIQSYNANWHKFAIQYVTRKAVKASHDMANWARRTGRNARGTPIQCQIAQFEIDHYLDGNYFQRGTEEEG